MNFRVTESRMSEDFCESTEPSEPSYSLLISRVALTAFVFTIHDDPESNIRYISNYNDALKRLVGKDYFSYYQAADVMDLAHEAHDAAKKIHRLDALQVHFASYLMEQYRDQQSLRKLPFRPHYHSHFSTPQERQTKLLRRLSFMPPKVEKERFNLSSLSLDLTLAAEEEDGAIKPDNTPNSGKFKA